MTHPEDIIPDFLAKAEEHEKEFETTEASAVRFLCGDPETSSENMPKTPPPASPSEPTAEQTQQAWETTTSAIVGTAEITPLKMVAEAAPDPAARNATQKQAYCRTLMEDILRWSGESQDPQVLEAREKLSVAYQSLMLAILKTAPAEKRDFIRYYPPARAVFRDSLKLLENAYPTLEEIREAPEDPAIVQGRPFERPVIQSPQDPQQKVTPQKEYA